VQAEVDVHAGPGTIYHVLGQVGREDMLAITGCSTCGEWWQVDYLGRPGWVEAQAVSSIAGMQAVPTVESPPTPVNQAPVIEDVLFDPPTIEAWSTISITCQAMDPNRDLLTYEWLTSDGQIAGEGKTVAFTAPDIEGPVTFTVTVRDRVGAEAARVIETRVIAPQPPPGGGAPAETFSQVWHAHADVRRKLGWAIAEEQVTFGAEQVFENGFMFWRDDTDEIYGLTADGRWQAYHGTWQEGMDEYSCSDVSPDQTPPTPRRGFGEIWCRHLGGPDAAIGWATADEQGYYPHWQDFERGFMWSGHDGYVYVFYEDKTWVSFPLQ
jgi:hypothetical protein